MGAFKKSFLSEDQLLRHAPEWSKAWAGDHEEFTRGEIHPAEFCARIIIKVYRTLYGERFTNGLRAGPRDFPPSFYALGLLGQNRIRALPEAAALALLRWGADELALQVFQRVPTPMEVLKLQTQGVRPVSVFHRERDVVHFRHEGRDFFSFLIHDLIHAQLMTECPEAYALQRKFAQVIYENWSTLNVNLSDEARAELEYMASDMNSHIVHLTLTLKSWTERHRSDLSDRWELSRFWGGLRETDNAHAHLKIFETWKSLDSIRP